MAKVSVIIPVYNVEKYLERCLDSLLNQKFKDYELIIVNDGSPDNSQDIIDRYVKKYPKKIRAFKKENGGISTARNLGLKNTKSKYVTFVDSDDYVHENYLKSMYDKISSDDYDFVVCDLVLAYPDGKLERKSSLFEKDLTTPKEIKEKMHDFYPIVANKMYKTELITEDNLFHEGVLYEDVEFMYRLFSKVKKIGVVDEGLYYYYQNSTSIMHTFNKRLYNYVDNWNYIFDYYKEKDIFTQYKDVLEYSFVRYTYATFLKRATNFDYDDYLDALNYAITEVKKKTSKRYLNKYYYRSFKGLYLLLFNKPLGILLYKYMRRKG